MKTIQEQIEVMQHYANGGEVEYINKRIIEEEWALKVNKGIAFNWESKNYRIKEQKKTITIEKWLVQFDDEEYRIIHSSDIEKTSADKIKLLETYKVEL